MSAPISVLDAGVTFDEEGHAYPTVVLDVTDRPDVADLARVHASEGIGDLTTSVGAVHGGLVLTVALTRPVAVTFGVAFELPLHRPVLDHAALTGHLLLATTVPVADGDNPPWLAVALDGPWLAAILELLDGPTGPGAITP